MALSDATYLKGEKSPLYVSEQASIGTVQYTSPPTFSLFDRTGAIVTGYDHIPVSGYTPGPQAAIQAYYTIDTTVSVLTPGYYYALFLLPFLAQDGISRIRAFDFDVYIKAAPV